MMPKTETDTEPKLPGMPGPSKKQIGRAVALDDAIEGLHTAITEYDFPPGCLVKLQTLACDPKTGRLVLI